MQTPRQQLAQERIEGLIGLVAPVLDLVLSVGERISRVVAPEDDYYPIRPPGEPFKLEGSEAPLVGVPAREGSAEDDA